MSNGQDYLAPLNIEQEDFWHTNKDRILLPSITGKNILDLGCGLGSLSILLARQGKKVTAIDDSQEYITIAKKKSKALKITYLLMDFTKEQVPLKKKFDTVIISGVIEHIQDDLAFLKKIHTLLREHGKIIILTSAYPWLYSSFDKSVGHYRRYSKKQLITITQKAGFTITSLRYWDILALPVLFLTRILHHTVVHPEGLSNNYLNKILDKWFLFFENKKILPLGADLIMVAEK